MCRTDTLDAEYKQKGLPCTEMKYSIYRIKKENARNFMHME
jgi:hypothetical protein